MNKKDRDFRHESLQDDRSIVRYLRELTEGFANGKLTFSDKDGEITLEPQGLIRFELGASKRPERYALTLRFTWKAPEQKEHDAGPLIINGPGD